MAYINPRAKVQKVKITNDSLRLKTPFCMSISGPNQCKILFNKLRYLYCISTLAVAAILCDKYFKD
jgi:hypothetical protein